MKIPYFTFVGAPNNILNEWTKSIQSVIAEGKFVLGDPVHKFELEWAEFLGVNHAVGVANGFDALVLSLKTLGIGAGDIVAVPSHTFAATWFAVDAVGAMPFGIDCGADGLMDLDILESLEIQFTAVIPVHMHGQLVEMSRVQKWAQKNGVHIIEDCAQAHGAEINGKKAGSWGAISAYSFYPTKNLGALGDAGAIVTNNDDYAERARLLSNYGCSRSRKYQYREIGINSRLDSIQAALLSVNLGHLKEWNQARKEIAKIYDQVCDNAGIRYLRQNEGSVYHHYLIFSNNRDKTIKELLKLGIQTDIHYPEPAEKTFLRIKNRNFENCCPKAMDFTASVISIPLYPWISDENIEYVQNALLNSQVVRSCID